MDKIITIIIVENPKMEEVKIKTEVGSLELLGALRFAEKMVWLKLMNNETKEIKTEAELCEK